MRTLKVPSVPVTIVPMDRVTQPPELAKLYRAGEAPTLVIIADTGEASTGPIGWIAALKILEWSRAIEIQADDIAIDTAIATTAAAKYRRVLLIQTNFPHVTTWRLAAEFAGCRRFLPLSPNAAKLPTRWVV